MPKKIRLFVDMDGTLARFHDEPDYLTRMHEKGFYINLKPFYNVVNALNEICNNRKDIDVYILSAAIGDGIEHCIPEKNQWIDKYMPSIDHNHRIWTPCGVDKYLYIPNIADARDFILDDYNHVLEKGHSYGVVPIKAVNNINDKGRYGKRWNGKKVYICKSTLLNDLLEIIDSEVNNE